MTIFFGDVFAGFFLCANLSGLISTSFAGNRMTNLKKVSRLHGYECRNENTEFYSLHSSGRVASALSFGLFVIFSPTVSALRSSPALAREFCKLKSNWINNGELITVGIGLPDTSCKQIAKSSPKAKWSVKLNGDLNSGQ